MDTTTAAVSIRCQRIGCEATFTENDNPEGSCRYHDGAPIFHDGMKEWSCCKKKSHDFSLFLDIPGCKTGKHSKEKPVINTAPKPKPNPTIAKKTSDICSRCQQGFFCSDHGSQPRPVKPVSVSNEQVKDLSKPVKKKAGLNDPQICRNKGCGKTFKEKDNHETACEYHPGPAIFHDRMRGWKCCDVHVKEFDEFLSIPPCTRGWHNADAE